MRFQLNPKRLSKKSCLYLTSAILLSACTSSASAQKNITGIGLAGQWGNGLGLHPAVSVTYERKFTSHFGIETGITAYSFRPKTWNANNYDYGKRNFYFNIPALFKYYSNIVNVAAGPMLNLAGAKEIYLGNGNTTDQKQATFGYMLKVGKTINLSDKFLLEPEVYGGDFGRFKNPVLG